MKDELEKGVAWLAASKILVNILALFSTLLLARYLSPDDFGVASLAFSILAIIGALTELTLGSALIHHANPTDDHFHTAWTLNLCRAMIVGLILAIAAPIAAAIYKEPRLINIMLVLGASVAMSGFNNPKTILFLRNLVFWQDFLISVSQKLAGFIAGALIAIIYQSYWALVVGMLASQIVGIIVSYVVIPFKPKFIFRYTKELLSFSVWLMLGQVINTLNSKLDFLLIGGVLGRPALGYYTVGDNLASMPSREMIAPLQFTLFPGFAKIKDDLDRLKQAYKSAQGLISALALPVGFGFALIAHPLVLLWMGSKWLPSVIVIQILCCIFAIQTLSSSVHPLAMAKGQTKLLFRRDVLNLAIRLPMILIGMYFWGLLGIIYARAISGLIAMYINMRFVRNMIGIGVVEQLGFSMRSAVSVIIMVLGVLYIEYLIGQDGTSTGLFLKLIAFIAVGAFLYISTHLMLWRMADKPHGPEVEILRIINKILKKI
ncbi:lipopolysaccharide biosynthesis protein [Actimicrobium sp. CCC2.4]|uniref:lipopolysaccharide biosynthesis protein n=1 Tax=Actimicrobium sp. CCC2.4 TaxID=3048606 RepID=UPI002AC8B7D8|nr:lipopolysaccharide biosynthesis protein [Actimicrobium sp. CCC2.4]MEB0136027.1 lipopolysaccharide biosynthesis protein [Actimicrobium sp. CCC2.4]WPX32690.1 lipopolysaccharide biosynthesis protein [Actimicrobium sp. CCC2.4]